VIAISYEAMLKQAWPFEKVVVCMAFCSNTFLQAFGRIQPNKK
jgi:hypothetical protein